MHINDCCIKNSMKVWIVHAIAHHNRKWIWCRRDSDMGQAFVHVGNDNSIEGTTGLDILLYMSDRSNCQWEWQCSREIPHQYDFHQRDFHQSSKLKQHKFIHAKAKPYQCGKVITLSSNLKKQHPKYTGENLSVHHLPLSIHSGRQLKSKAA